MPPPQPDGIGLRRQPMLRSAPTGSGAYASGVGSVLFSLGWLNSSEMTQHITVDHGSNALSRKAIPGAWPKSGYWKAFFRMLKKGGVFGLERP